MKQYGQNPVTGLPPDEYAESPRRRQRRLRREDDNDLATILGTHPVFLPKSLLDAINGRRPVRPPDHTRPAPKGAPEGAQPQHSITEENDES